MKGFFVKPRQSQSNWSDFRTEILYIEKKGNLLLINMIKLLLVQM